MTSYGYNIVDSGIISFNLNCIMQLKQFYNIATKVSSRKKWYYFWWSTWLFSGDIRIKLDIHSIPMQRENDSTLILQWILWIAIYIYIFVHHCNYHALCYIFLLLYLSLTWSFYIDSLSGLAFHYFQVVLTLYKFISRTMAWLRIISLPCSATNYDPCD